MPASSAFGEMWRGLADSCGGNGGWGRYPTGECPWGSRKEKKMTAGFSKRNALWIFLAVSAWCTPVRAEEMLIKLKDGITLRGEVVSMQNGVYKIQSKMLGEVAVCGSDVLSIAKVEDTPATTADKKIIERQITSNPELMRSVQSLAREESVLEMFSDTDLKAAIMRQDVEYLKKNDKFVKFMNNAAVQGIVKNVAADSGNRSDSD